MISPAVEGSENSQLGCPKSSDRLGSAAPQGSGCAKFRERLLLDYSSASRNVKVPGGYHITIQRKEKDAIPSVLFGGEAGRDPAGNPGYGEKVFQRGRQTWMG